MRCDMHVHSLPALYTLSRAARLRSSRFQSSQRISCLMAAAAIQNVALAVAPARPDSLDASFARFFRPQEEPQEEDPMTPCQFPPLPPPQQASEWPQQASDWPQASDWRKASDWQQVSDLQKASDWSVASAWQQASDWQQQADGVPAAAASQSSHAASPSSKPKAKRMPKRKASVKVCSSASRDSFEHGEGQGPPRNFGYRYLPSSVYRSLTVDEKRKVKAARTLRKGARCDACGRRIR